MTLKQGTDLIDPNPLFLFHVWYKHSLTIEVDSLQIFTRQKENLPAIGGC